MLFSKCRKATGSVCGEAYGTGYPVDKMEGRNLIMVAGGLGVAPIRALLQYVLHRRERFGDLIVAYGMRHSLDLLFRHEMTSLYSRTDMHLYIGAEEVNYPEIPPIHAQLGPGYRHVAHGSV